MHVLRLPPPPLLSDDAIHQKPALHTNVCVFTAAIDAPHVCGRPVRTRVLPDNAESRTEVFSAVRADLDAGVDGGV